MGSKFIKSEWGGAYFSVWAWTSFKGPFYVFAEEELLVVSEFEDSPFFTIFQVNSISSNLWNNSTMSLNQAFSVASSSPIGKLHFWFKIKEVPGLPVYSHLTPYHAFFSSAWSFKSLYKAGFLLVDLTIRYFLRCAYSCIFTGGRWLII